MTTVAPAEGIDTRAVRAGLVRVKICGITRRADAVAAIEAGADLLGFNFYPGSPRYVDPALVRVILAEIERPAFTVGVFVNAEPGRIHEVVDTAGIGMVQLHGDEPPEMCASLGLPVIKAIGLGSPADLDRIEDYEVWAILVDSCTPGYGGSGIKTDWALAAQARDRCPRLILAGGLNVDNVARAIQEVNPWGVDVATGVESQPGIKDPDKIKRFIEAVRNASG